MTYNHQHVSKRFMIVRSVKNGRLFLYLPRLQQGLMYVQLHIQNYNLLVFLRLYSSILLKITVVHFTLLIENFTLRNSMKARLIKKRNPRNELWTERRNFFKIAVLRGHYFNIQAKGSNVDFPITPTRTLRYFMLFVYIICKIQF